MAHPTAYTPGYSFSGFQANSPTAPLPATRLDAELAGIQEAIASLVAAMIDVRRSDGMFVNGKVGLDQIGADLLARLNDVQAITAVDLSPTAFAAQSEAEAGAATDKLMTPLRVSQSIAAFRPWASQGEAQAGTSNAVVMTPLRVRDHMDARIRTGTANVTIGSGTLAAGAEATFVVLVAGAAVGDAVMLGLPAVGLPAGCGVMRVWVSGVDTVSVAVRNHGSSSAAFTQQTYRATVIKA